MDQQSYIIWDICILIYANKYIFTKRNKVYICVFIIIKCNFLNMSLNLHASVCEYEFKQWKKTLMEVGMSNVVTSGRH